MGAWGHRSFDNDDAMDFEDELKAAKDSEPISRAFRAILRTGEDYLEAPEASRGLAAAEVVAALLGKPATKLPEQVAAWVQGQDPPNEELAQNARQIVARILRDSELKELWAESPKFGLWEIEVEDLLRRLGATPA